MRRSFPQNWWGDQHQITQWLRLSGHCKIHTVQSHFDFTCSLIFKTSHNLKIRLQVFSCNSLVILPETITWLTIRQMPYYLTVTSRNRFAQFLLCLDLFLALQVISSIHLVQKGLWIDAISVCQWTIFERGNVLLEVLNNNEAVGRRCWNYGKMKGCTFVMTSIGMCWGTVQSFLSS